MNKKILKIVLPLLLIAASIGGALWVKHQINCQNGRCPVNVTRFNEDEGIRLTLSSPYRSYQIGEIVEIQAKLQNTSDEVVTLIGVNEPVFKIEWQETDANGEVHNYIWPEQEQQVTRQSLQIQPRQSYETNISFSPKTEDIYNFRCTWWDQDGLSKYYVDLDIEYGNVTATEDATITE